MPNPDVIFPEGSNRKWKWMVSDEDLEELKEIEKELEED